MSYPKVILFVLPFYFLNCSAESDSDIVKYADDCPPCDVIASEGMETTHSQIEWPDLNTNELMKINGLTQVVYENSIESVWGPADWWMEPQNDPWSNYSHWGEDYVVPEHNFDECVNDELRWMCGYSYVLELPNNYNNALPYPLIIFLHGGFEQSNLGIAWYHDKLRSRFYMDESSPYIYAAPIKLEVDWSAKKIKDVIEDIKNNVNIDENRIYLTGLSMGGRGTFIVASELPDYFAAIMPLSPHHQPYSYVPLAESISHIPIWMSHGNIDYVSSYGLALEMFNALTSFGANVIFRTEYDIGHWGWEDIYSDSLVMNWLLSIEKAQ